MFRYSVSVRWSDEDEGFVATVPELEGLSAFGQTQQEAVNELLVAAGAFIETMEKAGDELPEPEKVSYYSGQTRLRMPKTLHAKLAAEAEKEGVSLNTYLVSLLSERQGVKEAVNAIKKEAGHIANRPPVCFVAGKTETKSSYFETSQGGFVSTPFHGASAPNFYVKEEVN